MNDQRDKTESRTLELSPTGYFEDAEWIGVGWQLSEANSEILNLKYSVPKDMRSLLPEIDRGDHVLAAVLLYAMRNADALHVRGVVSPKLLDGLYTLQCIWSRWRRELYRKIEISADVERPSQGRSGDGAVFAFSGGVDATFSLFRHLTGAVHRCSRRPEAAMLVQGMDIPINRDDYFQGAVRRAELCLKGTNVPIIPVRTNSRQLSQAWLDSYGLQLASCSLLLQHAFPWAIHGSDEPFDALVLPLGSTPLTDHLLSTEAQSALVDGGDFDRTEKVDWLARNTSETTLSNIRVCWAGEKKDRNCGTCEKCLRTMLNFWALGHSVPRAFDSALSIPRIVHLKAAITAQLAELVSLAQHAKRHGHTRTRIFWSLQFAILRSRILLSVSGTASWIERRAPWLYRVLKGLMDFVNGRKRGIM